LNPTCREEKKTPDLLSTSGKIVEVEHKKVRNLDLAKSRVYRGRGWAQGGAIHPRKVRWNASRVGKQEYAQKGEKKKKPSNVERKNKVVGNKTKDERTLHQSAEEIERHFKANVFKHSRERAQ